MSQKWIKADPIANGDTLPASTCRDAGIPFGSISLDYNSVACESLAGWSEPDELQHLTETLDATRTWSVWRTAGRRWIINVKADGQSPTFVSTCLVDAMRQAVEWKPLPLVPRQVRGMSLVNFEARKDGSKWMLYYDGMFYSGNLPTKIKAMQLAELIVKRSILAADEWNRDYGWCLHKTEGVDFRFGD